jgi:signal transduction histidine kinase
MFRQSPSAGPHFDETAPAGGGARGFRLLRYFSLAAAVSFTLVIAVLAYFQWQEQSAFLEGQERQAAMFRKAQERFAQLQDEAARRDLLAVHEAGSVTLARVLANTLWERDLAPYFARAQVSASDACRAGAAPAAPGDPLAQAQAQAKRECAAELARQLVTGRDHAALDAKVRELLKGTPVTQARLHDARGITLYATDSIRLGEDQSQQPGWQLAARQGKPSSMLVLAERTASAPGTTASGAATPSGAAPAPPATSAAARRDVIVSYLPLLEPGSARAAGVLELVSDVTPFLEQIQGTTSKFKLSATDNLAATHAAAADFQEQVASTAKAKMVIVLVLLAALFGVLFFVVRHADAVLARQSVARQLAQRQLVQSEKMASLGQMVAGVAHQLNTPLAFSQNNVRMAADRLREFQLPLKVAAKLSELVLDSGKDRVRLDISRAREQLERVQGTELDVSEPLEMLSDTLQGLEQMRELVDNLRDFTRLDRSMSARCDINKALRNVVYVARGVVNARVQIVERYGSVPPLRCNLTQLNQVFLNLINNAAQAIESEGLVTVSTRAEGGMIVVDVADTGSGIAPEVLPHIFDDYFTTKPAGEGTGLGLPIARSIVQEHGGEITVDTRVGAGSVFSVRLPFDAQASDYGTEAAGEGGHAPAAGTSPAPASGVAAPADNTAVVYERTTVVPRPAQPGEPNEYRVV